MNVSSSRSQTLFTITVQLTSESRVRRSKVVLVDLAGSENVKVSGVEGEALREAGEINTALSTLGNVIHALNLGKSHIPYRDSKLTTLLTHALGGNAKTIMFANICPDSPPSVTVNTLKFAQRVSKVQNTPIINYDPKSAKVKELQDTIGQLEREKAAFLRLSESQPHIDARITERQ